MFVVLLFVFNRTKLKIAYLPQLWPLIL